MSAILQFKPLFLDNLPSITRKFWKKGQCIEWPEENSTNKNTSKIKAKNNQNTQLFFLKIVQYAKLKTIQKFHCAPTIGQDWAV